MFRVELFERRSRDESFNGNYLSPFTTDLLGPFGGLQLLVGDGTYSANSIYLLQNTQPGTTPAFDEDHLEKIIPGMGLEQMTPAVVDWNYDGKADILCGDRTGFLTLYLNSSTDPTHPTFSAGIHVKIAGQENMGHSITVAVGDLSGNGLPNLLIGRDDGTVLYAENTGKLGAPAFNLPAKPLKGVLPAGYHYLALKDWYKEGAWGAPDELLASVNPQIEPGFLFPEGVQSKSALKFCVWPIGNHYFLSAFIHRSKINCESTLFSVSRGLLST